MTNRTIPLLAREIFRDIKPASKVKRSKVFIDVVKKSNIQSFCKKNGDLKVLKKMVEHELTKEPCEKIIALRNEHGNKHESRELKRFLKRVGFNTNPVFSSNHREDFAGVLNINGFVVPGWKKIVTMARIISSRGATLLGKTYAPGRSRLHVRFYKGASRWYLVAHIDEYNWIHPNIIKAKDCHLSSGKGNYKLGQKLMMKILRYYFKRKNKMSYH